MDTLKYSIKPGAILAGILIAFYLVVYFVSKGTYISAELNISFIVICTGVAVFFGFRFVKLQEEPITFVTAWLLVMLIVFIGTMGYYLSEIIIYNVVDPGLSLVVEEVQKGAFQQKLADGSIDQALFDKLLPLYEEIDSSYAPKWVLLRGLTNMVYWAIFSLIPALFVFRQGKVSKR